MVSVSGEGAQEVDDPELLSIPTEGVDIYVTNKEVDGKTLTELATRPAARGVFMRKITRGAVATSIPIMPNTKIYRGDIVTLSAAHKTSLLLPSCWASRIGKPMSLTSRSSAQVSRSARWLAPWSGRWGECR